VKFPKFKNFSNYKLKEIYYKKGFFQINFYSTRYENFILQVNEIIQSKTGMRGKENLERLLALRKIKESIENDRARIMSMVFSI